MTGTEVYRGTELELFRHATVWKTYFRKHVQEYVSGDVLEVGAGEGATTAILCDGRQRSWLALEPDPQLVQRLEERHRATPFTLPPETVVGTLEDIEPERRFDAILYIDVLEHIEDDRGELLQAAALLRPGGALVVLVPARRRLYSEYDAAIGHFRRYSLSGLCALAPPGMSLARAIYLDSVGALASVANRLLLRKASPSLRQVLFWDRVLVRASKFVDPILAHQVGKTGIVVWRKQACP